MRRAIQGVIAILPEFHHIDVTRVGISATFNRRPSRHGVLAYVIPLRFREGSPVTCRRRGQRIFHFAMLPFFEEGVELLYLMNFMLPRFMNLSYEAKLETIVHELYHISPLFNGDLRRFKGYRSVHGRSMKDYDERIRHLTKQFLEATRYQPCDTEFLRLSFHRLESAHESVHARHIKEPKAKLIRVTPKPGRPQESFTPLEIS